ncbi:MAG: DUF4838 domain-containing protein [Phycisphaeraceae bacterium]
MKKHPFHAGWMCMLLVLSLGFGAASAAADEALLTNGGFEQGATEWINAPTIVERDDNAGRCLELSPGESVWQVLGALPEPGRYRVSFEFRAVGVEARSLVGRLLVSGAGGVGPVQDIVRRGRHNYATQRYLFLTGETSEWRSASVVVEVPATDGVVCLSLAHRGELGQAWLDDIRIERTNAAPSDAAALIEAGLAPPPGPEDAGFSHAELINGDFARGFEGWWAAPDTDHRIVSHDAGRALALHEGTVVQGVAVNAAQRYRVRLRFKAEQIPADGFDAAICYGYGKPKRLTAAHRWHGFHTVRLPGGDARSVIAASGGNHDWREVSVVIEPPVKNVAGRNVHRSRDAILRSIQRGGPAADKFFPAEELLLYLSKRSGGRVLVDEVTIEPAPDAELTDAEQMREQRLRELMLEPLSEDARRTAARSIVQRAARSPAKLRLTEQGRTDYRVYVGSADNVAELNAARELADYLGRISGATFTPFAHDAHPADAPLLIVGRDNALVDQLAPDLNFDDLGEEGFVIRAIGPHVLIAGATDRGTLYGVWHLLDHVLGVRWYSPNFTVVPERASIEIEPPRLRETPRFEYREVFTREADDPIYAAHNRLNGRFGHRKQRRIPEAFGGDVVIDTRMPEQAMGKLGKPRNVAYGNKEAVPTAADRLGNVVRNAPGEIIRLGHHDLGTYNRSGRDGNLIKKYGTAGGAFFHWASETAKQVPDGRFLVEAYMWSLKPPEELRFPDNLGAFFAPIEMNYAQPYDHPSNRRFLDALKGWADVTDTIYIWDYNTNFNSYIQPYPNILTLGRTLRVQASIPQVKGLFFQGAYQTVGSDMAALRVWLLSRLMWDPSQDADALLDEFLAGYYGDAGPMIREYLETLHDAATGNDVHLGIKHSVTDEHLYGYETLRRANALFDEAAAAVNADSSYARHIAKARLGLDYVLLSNLPRLQREAEARGEVWLPEQSKLVHRFEQGLELANVSDRIGEGPRKEQVLQTLRIPRQVAPTPDLVRDLPDDQWIDMQDMSMIFAGGAQIVPDPKASDGTAATLPGGVKTWGIRRFFRDVPEGTWTLHASVRIEPDMSKPIGPEQGALPMGIYREGAGNTVRNARYYEIIDGEYHTFEIGKVRIPGDEEGCTFFTTGGNEKNKAIYLDRLILVKQAGQQ